MGITVPYLPILTWAGNKRSCLSRHGIALQNIHPNEWPDSHITLYHIALQSTYTHALPVLHRAQTHALVRDPSPATPHWLPVTDNHRQSIKPISTNTYLPYLLNGNRSCPLPQNTQSGANGKEPLSKLLPLERLRSFQTHSRESRDHVQ